MAMVLGEPHGRLKLPKPICPLQGPVLKVNPPVRTFVEFVVVVPTRVARVTPSEPIRLIPISPPNAALRVTSKETESIPHALPPLAVTVADENSNKPRESGVVS